MSNDELEDVRYRLAHFAFTAPDADFDTMFASLEARMACAVKRYTEAEAETESKWEIGNAVITAWMGEAKRLETENAALQEEIDHLRNPAQGEEVSLRSRLDRMVRVAVDHREHAAVTQAENERLMAEVERLRGVLHDDAIDAIARVTAWCKQLTVLAPEDDWGDTVGDTMAADFARAVLGVLQATPESEPEPFTKEQKIQFRKDWDARVAEGKHDD
jgi:hypothetical protein